MPSNPPAGVACFLFVDIVDSTAYRDLGGPLPPGAEPYDSIFTATILAFYRHLREDLSREWRAIAGPTAPGAPGVVKSMGDALLFRMNVQTPEDLAVAATACVRAMAAFNRRGLGVKAGLRVSGTAWIAAYPKPNRSVPAGVISRGLVTTEAASGFADDCIGPAMELGFRSLGGARIGRMAVTPDMAWVLTNLWYGHGRVDANELVWSIGQPRPLKSMLTGFDVPDVGLVVPTEAQESLPSDHHHVRDASSLASDLDAFMQSVEATTWLSRPSFPSKS